jgi:hypothetical protein
LIRVLAGVTSDNGFISPEAVAHLLRSECLHVGLNTQSAIEGLLKNNGDPMALPDADRALVAEILLRDSEPLTPELVQGAVHALRRRILEHRQRELKQKIVAAERAGDTASLTQLLRDKVELDRHLRAAAPVPASN